MTHRIRKELDVELEKHSKQLQEIQSLQNQLAEAKTGLLAAARISDQLEISQVTNAALKEECKLNFRNHIFYQFVFCGFFVIRDKISLINN